MPTPGVSAADVAALMASPIYAGHTDRPAANVGEVFSPDDMREEDWLQVVKGFAVGEGWEPFHTRDSRRSDPGFPDLVLVRERVVWAELKTQTGRLSVDQLRWRDALIQARQEWYCWRPAQWPDVQRTLARIGPAGS